MAKSKKRKRERASPGLVFASHQPFQAIVSNGSNRFVCRQAKKSQSHLHKTHLSLLRFLLEKEERWFLFLGLFVGWGAVGDGFCPDA